MCCNQESVPAHFGGQGTGRRQRLVSHQGEAPPCFRGGGQKFGVVVACIYHLAMFVAAESNGRIRVPLIMMLSEENTVSLANWVRVTRWVLAMIMRTGFGCQYDRPAKAYGSVLPVTSYGSPRLVLASPVRSGFLLPN